MSCNHPGSATQMRCFRCDPKREKWPKSDDQLTPQSSGNFLFCCIGLFLAMLCWPILPAAQVPSAPLPIDSSIRTGQLANGLKYYLKRNLKPEGYIELRLVVAAGSLQENRRQRGLAHFVEHMAFNGTRHFPKNELVNYLESIGVRFGADLNAYTSFDETVYQLQVPKDTAQLSKGLLVLEDWATHIAFDPEEVDKERGVILAEWRNRQGPNQRLEDAYLPLLYQGSRRLKRLPIGDTAVIKHASVQTLKAYYQKWYRPELMAIVAVGDLDPDQLEQLIHQRFAKIKAVPGPMPRTYSNAVPKKRQTLVHTDPEAAFCQAFVYIRDPAKQSIPILPRTYAEMQALLTRNLYNSILNRRLIRLQQQADPPFTFAGLGLGADWGQNPMFSLSVFSAEQKLASALALLWHEVQKAKAMPFLLVELNRQKQELLNSLLQQANATETTHSANWANQLSMYHRYAAPFSSPRQRYALTKLLLDNIGISQLTDLSKQIPSHKKRRVLVLAGPEKRAQELPAATQLWHLMDSIEQLPKTAFTPERSEPGVERPWIEQELSVQPIIAEQRNDPFGVVDFRLGNGIRIIAKPTKLREDQVLMIASSPGGHSHVPDSIYVNAAYFADVLQQSGIGPFDYVQYQEKLAGKSVNVVPYLNELEEGFSGNCRSSELEDLFALVYLFATQARFDSSAVASFRKRQENVLRNMLSTPYYQFADLKQRIKYGNTPRRGLNRMSELPKLSSEHLRRIHQDRFGDLSDLLLVIVGDFQLEELRGLAQRYLGNLPTAGRQESWKDLGLSIRKGQIDSVSYGGAAPKTLIEYTWHGDFEDQSQQRYHFSSMIAALQIRLREVLREQESGVYSLSFSGNIEHHPKPGYRITLGFNTDPPRAEELMQKALRCIETFCEEGPSDELLQKVQHAQKENRIKAEQENSFWLSQLHQRYKEAWSLEGLDRTHYFQWVDQLKKADLQLAAAKCFRTQDRIKLVLIPK